MRSLLLKASARPCTWKHSGQTAWLARSYAVQAPGAPTVEVFDARTKLLHKERAAANATQSRQVDYLRDEVAIRLCDRILDINRPFPKILDFGSNACNIARRLTTPDPDPDSAKPFREPISKKIGSITCADTSPTLLYRDQDEAWNKEIDIQREVLRNPEYLPYEAGTFDAVLSSMSLHWINDLPSVLMQINNCLKPDAPFVAAMSGGDSLFELRGSLQLAEQERLGGIGTHISPLADVRDVGNLLNRAGFKLLTVDVDDIIVDYPNTFALMSDLQAMGEANAALRREPGGISKDVLLATEAIYREMYGEQQEDGSITIPATFRIIYMIGWKESADQPKPLERGSGDVNLKDLLGNDNDGKGHTSLFTWPHAISQCVTKYIAVSADARSRGNRVHSWYDSTAPMTVFANSIMIVSRTRLGEALLDKSSLQSWPHLLNSSGMNLLEYGQGESAARCEYFNYWAPSAQSLGFSCAPIAIDWHFWFLESTDDYAGTFWALVEQWEQDMPGAWVEDVKN